MVLCCLINFYFFLYLCVQPAVQQMVTSNGQKVTELKAVLQELNETVKERGGINGVSICAIYLIFRFIWSTFEGSCNSIMLLVC